MIYCLFPQKNSFVSIIDYWRSKFILYPNNTDCCVVWNIALPNSSTKENLRDQIRFHQQYVT